MLRAHTSTGALDPDAMGRTMRATNNDLDREEPLSEPTSWEQWVDGVFAWMPYVTLLASVILAQAGSQGATDRFVSVGLSLATAAWTWLTFSRFGRPTRIAQHNVRIYFAGFVILTAVLVLWQPVFLVYGITGFFHASLLRPWVLVFTGIGATAVIVQSTIVYPDGTSLDWIIYLAVVAFQTLAVSVGMYAGAKVMEIAEERREVLAELEDAMAVNAGLQAQLVAQAREAGVLDERQRMAREIHDTIAQGLTGVITQLEAVNHSRGEEDEMQRHLDSASQLARESLAEARRSVQAILPGQLVGSRLPEALTDVASRWTELNEVVVEVHTEGERRPLRPEIEVTMLRAAQEGLANIARHAHASRVDLTLAFMDESVALDIRDNGSGFDPSRPTGDTSYGLSSMRQRVEHVDGEMRIESASGEGTAISLVVPAVPMGSSNG
jgi:signal transduction histidine kinase